MSVRKKEKISITLRSDLCAGSGYSYSGVIDSDICYDEYGIPYIPGRRLKGCMREALETMLYVKYKNVAGMLFGSSGSSRYNQSVPRGTENEVIGKCESVYIGNAYPEHYDELRRLLREKREKGLDFYNTQHILQRFSRVMGQTQIVDGVADDLTLRYTRIVNQYSPFETGHPMAFYAEIDYDPSYKDLLTDVLKATRHIGLKRNRGMGNVRLDWADEQGAPAEEKLADKGKHNTDCFTEQDITVDEMPEGKVRLTFGIENLSPLVMSAEKEDESETYLSGKSILGALAARYLSSKTADTEEFQDLFLNGKTVFTNFYPYENGRIHYPAASYINRLKRTGKYVYTLQKTLPTSITDEQYNPTGGNQPKKLKGKYLSLSGNEVFMKDVERDIVYHHRHHNEKEFAASDQYVGKSPSGKEKQSQADNQEQLYGLEVLRAGQRFAGSIILPREYADEMRHYLTQDPFLYLGKSRTAQYGKCRLFKTDCKDAFPGGVHIPAGSTATVTFLSDAVFLDKGNESPSGKYTVYFDEVRKTVLQELGLRENTEKNNDYLSIIDTSVRSGYMGIWNLRKPAVPVICAGSCLSFVLAEDFDSDKSFIGEKNNEGLGQIRIHRSEDLSYEGLKEIEENTHNKQKDAVQKNSLVPAYFRELMRPILVENWIEKEKLRGIQKDKVRANISSTALGRVILMLRECVDEAGEEKDALEMYREFIKRIKSIRSDSTREEGLKIAKIVRKPAKYGEPVDETELDTILGFSKESEYKELISLGYNESEISKFIQAEWPDYLMTLLVDRKYKGGRQ